MNYYTPFTHENETAFKTSLTKAIELCMTNNCSQILLLIPQRGALMDVISTVMTNKIVNDLLRTKKAKFGPVTIHLQTKQAKETGFTKGIVLAAYADISQIREFNNDKRVLGCILYTDNKENINSFITMAESEELELKTP